MYSKSENGIESLLAPELAAGSLKTGTQAQGPVSMLDYMYYRNVSGVALKGMPGCRSSGECEARWPNLVFALDEMHREFYGAGGILCGNTTSPC
jgi:hypothetical protein